MQTTSLYFATRSCMKPETYGTNGLILKSLAMSNYMSLLRLFFVSVLLISYSPFSYAERERYRNRTFPKSEYIICNKEGVQKLIVMRTAQWNENKRIDSKNDPIPEENCIRRETNVAFLEIAQEYSFPYQAFWSNENPYGQNPCHWDPEKRCTNFYGPATQYVKAQYLDSNGTWREEVFVEVPGYIELIDHPDDIKKEGSNLGDMYANGEDVPEDDVEAARWHRLATEQRDAEAQHSLGWMYDNGLGVPEDDVEAVRWYRRAAEQGYAKSQFNLGIMYAAGEGVPEDDVQAYAWLNLAAEQGLERAEEMKQAISGTMTGEEIASAQELSEKYRDAYDSARTSE